MDYTKMCAKALGLLLSAEDDEVLDAYLYLCDATDYDGHEADGWEPPEGDYYTNKAEWEASLREYLEDQVDEIVDGLEITCAADPEIIIAAFERI